jgi:cytochrome c-type biogenesis protein CcmH/NrfG
LLASLRLDPGQPLAWLELGELRLTLDRDLNGAREAFERVVELDGDSEQAHFRLGQINMELGEPAPAAESMRAFLALAPADSPLRPRIVEMLWIA